MVEGALWTSVRDMLGRDELTETYPEALMELFSLDAVDTGTGFFNAELYTLVLPALFVVFAVTRGARLVAGEEEAGILEVLLVTPVPTAVVYLSKAVGLAASVLALGVVCAVATVVTSAVFSMGISPWAVLVGSAAMVLLGLQLGFLALAVGAATGRRAYAVGVAGAAAAAAYVLHVAGAFTASGGLVDRLAPLSPVHQALAGGPLAARVPGAFLVLATVAVALLVVGPPALGRRDVRRG